MIDHVELIGESLFKSKLGAWFACQAGAKELLDAFDAAELQIVTKSLVKYAWKQSGQHVRMMDGVEARAELLRVALRTIASGGYSDIAGDPSQWASTIAYLALGGTFVDGQRADEVDHL